MLVGVTSGDVAPPKWESRMADEERETLSSGLKMEDEASWVKPAWGKNRKPRGKSKEITTFLAALRQAIQKLTIVAFSRGFQKGEIGKIYTYGGLRHSDITPYF